MLSPPAELKPPSPRLRRTLHVIWLACLTLAILVQAAACWRFYVYVRVIQPPFAALGLHPGEFAQSGIVNVSFATHASTVSGLDQYWVLTVDGSELAIDGRAEDTARLLDGPDGSQVTLGLLSDQFYFETRLTRSAENRALVYHHGSRTFMIVSQFIDLLLAAFLLFVAWMLRRRKFHEPVAILLSFALLFMSAVGTWMIWWWFGLLVAGYLPDLVWLALLLIASPAFPSGRYLPGWSRWVTVAVPVGMTSFAVYAAFFSAPETLQETILVLNGVLVLTALLCVILRFRFTPAGVERQQMKWASLGLGAGLFLYAAGQMLDIFRANLPVPETAQTGRWILAFVLSRLSYVVIALGLLAPLLDYRLNDADAAIGRSAAYAGVTTAVGVVWAGSAATADKLIKSYTPGGDPGLAAAISTLIAIAVLVPARTRAMAWTEARFQRALTRLRSLPERIARWQHDDDPAAVAKRALKAIADGVDATEAALVADTDAEQPRVIAAHNVDPETVKARLREGRPRERAADAFPLRIEVATYAGTAATTLLIGRRSDGAFYSKAERDAVASVAEPLSDVLRGVALRAARKAVFADMLVDIRARLEKLEADRSRRRAQAKPDGLPPNR